MCAMSSAKWRKNMRSRRQRRKPRPHPWIGASASWPRSPDLEQAISDRDRIRIGLVALANRERRIILDHHAQRTVSGAAIERLLRNTNLILDSARAEGRVGYNRAARALLGFPRAFRGANFLHRRLNLARPLQRQISIRFETLLIRRLALEELARFIESRLHALLGERVAELLGEVIAARSEATTRALDALRLQYREYAEALEQRFLSESVFRLALATLLKSLGIFPILQAQRIEG